MQRLLILRHQHESANASSLMRTIRLQLNDDNTQLMLCLFAYWYGSSIAKNRHKTKTAKHL